MTALLATPLCRRQAGQRWPARLVLALLGLAALALSPAWSSDRRDHERVRAAVEAGQVLPLPTLLERLRRTHPGQVLELELEREHGRWRYEVKLLQPNGQLLKLDVDAATAQVLEAKRKEGPEHSPPAERDPGRTATPSKLPAKLPEKAPSETSANSPAKTSAKAPIKAPTTAPATAPTP